MEEVYNKDGLSQSDVEAINKLYKCPAFKGKVTPPPALKGPVETVRKTNENGKTVEVPFSSLPRPQQEQLIKQFGSKPLPKGTIVTVG